MGVQAGRRGGIEFKAAYDAATAYERQASSPSQKRKRCERCSSSLLATVSRSPETIRTPSTSSRAEGVSRAA